MVSLSRISEFPRVFQFGISNGVAYYIMEKIDGVRML